MFLLAAQGIGKATTEVTEYAQRTQRLSECKNSGLMLIFPLCTLRSHLWAGGRACSVVFLDFYPLSSNMVLEYFPNYSFLPFLRVFQKR